MYLNYILWESKIKKKNQPLIYLISIQRSEFNIYFIQIFLVKLEQTFIYGKINFENTSRTYQVYYEKIHNCLMFK